MSIDFGGCCAKYFLSFHGFIQVHTELRLKYFSQGHRVSRRKSRLCTQAESDPKVPPFATAEATSPCAEADGPKEEVVLFALS